MNNRYKITYRGKDFCYTGVNAEEAIDKFCNRKSFGNDIVTDCKLLQYDAATRGEKWAQFSCTIKNESGTLIAEIV